jgi:glyoxylase-like metal-dependent hydrolase (beta-lactamase superfamily II)
VITGRATSFAIKPSLSPPLSGKTLAFCYVLDAITGFHVWGDTTMPSATHSPNRCSGSANEKLQFDAGRGATARLTQIGVSTGTINAVFLTHFHSDHTSSIPDLWLIGWIGWY